MLLVRRSVAEDRKRGALLDDLLAGPAAAARTGIRQPQPARPAPRCRPRPERRLTGHRGHRTAPDRPAALGFIGGLDGDRGDVAAYGDRVLGPVLACDTERGRTLRAYYDQGASLARAEDALHVHADTVVQRTDRVAQLPGPD
ncbi:helix-turn-helix domain-containing protein [Streptomyces globosus]